MAEAKNIYQRLVEVQGEAVAPREISGKFGKARSAEQILEAFKPVCRKHGLYLYTDDQMVDVNGRNYVIATATVINVDKPEERHSARASAWENEVEVNKYGAAILDTSQVTGKTSSYAKKYALQNLFAIDDSKDADQDEPVQPDAKPAYAPRTPLKVGSPSVPKLKMLKGQITAALHKEGVEDADMHDYIQKEYGYNPSTLTEEQAIVILEKLRKLT